MRWAEITDDSGHGLRVSQTANTETGVTKPFAMSLLPYSSTMLEEALHQDELPEPKHMFLRVLAAQMGVGGDDSWMSPVHEQYLDFKDREAFVVPQGDFRPHDSQFCLTISQDRATI